MNKLFLLLFLFSCNTQKRAMKYLDENPFKAAEYCAEKFPVKDTSYILDSVLLFDTLYLENTIYDTLQIKGESIIIERSLPTKTITKTIRRDSIILRRDRAFEKYQEGVIADLNFKNKTMTSENVILQEKATKRGWTMWGLLIIIGLFVGLKIRKWVSLF